MSVRRDAILFLIICPLIFAGGCFGPTVAKPVRVDPKTPEFRAAADPYLVSNTALQIQPPPPPKPDSPPTAAEDPLQRLARRAAERERELNSYQVRVRRKETINDKDQPMEYILFKYRRAPLSIHCKWLGEEANGREIVYVTGQYDDKIHILTGKGDLLGVGRQMALSADSPLVLAKLRYPITEAGFGSAAVRFIQAVEGFSRGAPNAGTLKYMGEQSRPEIKAKGQIVGVEHTVPPNVEAGLSKGGLRYYYFDESVGMPVLIVTFDHNRHQVEYYHFDLLQSEIGLDDADFDPAKLWKK
jgi:hypothetical protein